MRCYNLATACQNLDRVTALILDAQKLEQIPSEVWQMPKLEILDLRHNSLKLLPQNLAELSSLKILLLGDNQLKSLPDQLPHLTQIDLSKNRFSRFPVVLNQLKALQSLNLSSNRLCEWPAFSFPALKSLQLSSNKITQVCFVAEAVPKLEKLDLAHNTLRKIEFHGDFSSIQSLNLAHNQLGILPDNWRQMPFLQHLNLAHNQIEQVLNSLNTCIWLKTLNLNNNKLADNCGHFSAYQRLEVLQLASNRLSQVPALPLSLRRLDLAHNQVLKTPAALFKIPALQQLDLSSNPLNSIKGWEQAAQLSLLGLKGMPLANLVQELLAFPASITLKTSNTNEWTGFLIFLRACQRKAIPLNIRCALWQAHQQPAALRTLSLGEILQGLNLRIPVFQERLRQQLLEERSGVLTSMPKALALIGKSTQNKGALQARLEQKGIRLQKPEDCNTWVLGRAPFPEKLPQNASIHWLDERDLEQILEPESSNFDLGEQQNLQQLLFQQDPQSVQLAVQLLSHHGVPAALLPSLYLVWRWTSNEKLRRNLRRLLERHWPSSKRALLRSREKISPSLSAEEVELQLQKIAHLLETN